MEDIKIPGLMFAHDLMMLAETKGDVEKMIQKYKEGITGKGMRINFDKTKVMRIEKIETRKTGTETGAIRDHTIWVVKDKNGRTEVMIEVKTMKFLGTDVNGEDREKYHK